MKNFHVDTIKKDEAWFYSWDLSVPAGKLGATVSSVAWSVSSGSSISVSSATTTGTLTQAMLTATSTGTSVIQALVTYSTGEVGKYEIQLTAESIG